MQKKWWGGLMKSGVWLTNFFHDDKFNRGSSFHEYLDGYATNPGFCGPTIHAKIRSNLFHSAILKSA